MREQKLIVELLSEKEVKLAEVNKQGGRATMSEVRRCRKLHSCRHCRIYKNPKRYMGEKICLLDVLGIITNGNRLQRCPKDSTGDCPYGNDAGMCFGFCMRDILKEFRERKRKHEQA